MKCLIVTTHPLTNSLCKSLTELIKNKAVVSGHEVQIEDLYASDFNPVLTADERISYYQTTYDLSKVTEQIKKLKEAEALILVFPTWWFGFPAMLKGWFDRVWVPGVAYDHADDLGPIKPLLNDLKEVLVVTTLGAPWWVDRLLMRQPVKRVVKVALLQTCARNAHLNFLSLYKSEKLKDKEITIFKRKIEKVIGKWKQQ